MTFEIQANLFDDETFVEPSKKKKKTKKKRRKAQPGQGQAMIEIKKTDLKEKVIETVESVIDKLITEV